METTPKKRNLKEIPAEKWKRWNKLIQRDKFKVRHLSVLKQLPGLSNATVNNAINWHLGSEATIEKIDEYFNNLK